MTAHPQAIIVFVGLFVLVAGGGFLATRLRTVDLSQLNEWGLAGRSFGTLITWFLIGGDLYTAYTFLAVPALVFGTGAAGFFAVPFSILEFPLLFIALPRLWSVARRRGYVTAADFVRGRFGSRGLALVVALTGMVATIPYIALQLLGMQMVFAALAIRSVWAIPGLGSVPNVPLLAAFVVLSVYTYASGLRGTALIAVAKDLLIYATVLAAIIVIPASLGGYGKVFAGVDAGAVLLAHGGVHNAGPGFAYVSLILGSLLAMFLYPHIVTGLLSARGGDVIRRNAMLLPVYSFALALIALLGYMAVSAKVKSIPAYAAGFSAFGNNFAVPALFLHAFPPWFQGVAFAAIAIGALVPAAIMAIACGNLFTRNIFREFIVPDCSAALESRVAKIVSLCMKLGALLFVVELQSSYAIELQLLGGIWVCQTVPAVLIGLYTRFFNPTALLLGWAAGMLSGTWMAAQLDFRASVYALHLFGFTVPCYAALSALALNLALSGALSLVLNAWSTAPRLDETRAEDYAG
jgi:SSS family solute:Na+ symporter